MKTLRYARPKPHPEVQQSPSFRCVSPHSSSLRHDEAPPGKRSASAAIEFAPNKARAGFRIMQTKTADAVDATTPTATQRRRTAPTVAPPSRTNAPRGERRTADVERLETHEEE